ncbi:MAG: NAD-dependent epimerase/dehydratase family protein, partial [Acidobacteria bacterium]|nr:NAD-dependent epimerase/dehydratase family protein [Acidobacteriota bacterium]
MRVLVTGGAGFIGSHVSRVLLEQGHQVTVLDNLSRGRRELVPESAAFVEADLADEAATEQALRGHDAVIHLANFLEVAVSVERPVAFAENNIVNSVRLLEAMRRAGVGRIVFSSSATVYGVPKRLPLREDDPLGVQANPYGATKVAVETFLGVYHQLHGFDCVLLRYFNPYGPNELCDPETHAVPSIVRAALEERPIPLYWQGEQVRDYIYVEDLARAHVAPLQQSGYHVYNVGTEVGTKVMDVIETVATILKQEPQIDDLGERAGDIEASYASSEKLRTELGWEPQVELEEGLRRTIDHYRER